MLLVTVAAGVLRFSHLDQQPLWLDEAASVRFASMGHERLWFDVRWETNPSLYYSLKRLWFVLGKSDFALRSL